MVNSWAKFIQTKFIRPCLICGQMGSHRGICRPCHQDLPGNLLFCSCCANPMTDSRHDGLCGKCLDKKPAFDRVISPFLYLDPLRQSVSAFKFRADLVQGRLLSRLLAQHLQSQIETYPQCLIPVPLHASRLRQRGFNQSLEIARYLQRKLGIPLDINSCQRIKKTSPQNELPENKRYKNIRGAFQVNLKQVYEHVAIIDDVMTTGSTVNELAKELKKAGVKTVEVWSVCRAVMA